MCEQLQELLGTLLVCVVLDDAHFIDELIIQRLLSNTHAHRLYPHPQAHEAPIANFFWCVIFELHPLPHEEINQQTNSCRQSKQRIGKYTYSADITLETPQGEQVYHTQFNAPEEFDKFIRDYPHKLSFHGK